MTRLTAVSAPGAPARSDVPSSKNPPEPALRAGGKEAAKGPYRVGILGGTFDPIHDGHLTLARHFSLELALNELILMPAGQPWHKTGVSPAAQRLEMTRIAAAELELPGTMVSVGTDEVDRHGDTYTVDTLAAWRAKLGPDASLCLLIGADQVVSLDRWHDWLALFELAHICVATRPGFNIADASPAVAAQIARRHMLPEQIVTSAHGGMLIDRTLDLDISATYIRDSAQQRLAADAKACEHVPDAVWHYIRQHRLYGESPVPGTTPESQ
jgi:nicotinate-nucleotide adenylyltransferase